jgi:hypothetical protein
MIMPKTPKIGDVLQIPIGQGVFAYGQFVELDPHNGPVVRVFKLKSDSVPSEDELQQSGLMFPPVIVGINDPVRSGRWKVVRNQPLDSYQPPVFLSGQYHKDGGIAVWWLINGASETCIGTVLPEEYRTLESVAVWPAEWLEERIRAGTHPSLDEFRANFNGRKVR